MSTWTPEPFPQCCLMLPDPSAGIAAYLDLGSQLQPASYVVDWTRACCYNQLHLLLTAPLLPVLLPPGRLLALDLQYYLLEIRPQTQASRLAHSLSHPVYSRLVYSCWLTPAWVSCSLEVLNLRYDLLRTSRPQTHGSRWSIANFTPARMSAMLFTRRYLLGRFVAAASFTPASFTPAILFTRRC